jgi:hypothetical protein
MPLPIFTVLLVLAAAQPAKASVPASARGYALLVGVGQYPNSPSWSLKGPPNDAELMREIATRRLGVPDDEEHVRILSDLRGEAQAERLPTHDNIVREFNRLAEPGRLHLGELVIVLLAGHGSQQPADWSRKDNFEPDGTDEVFLPRDANRYDRLKKAYANALTDDDLRDLIDKVVATGAHLWITLDCCHSGTGLRGEVARNPTDGTMGPEVEREAAAEGIRRFGPNAKRPGQGMIPNAPRVAGIFACEAKDTTPELVPEGLPGGKTDGLLTSTIYKTLTREPCGSKLTYVGLIHRVQAAYRDQDRLRPSPQGEGQLIRNVIGTNEVGITPPPPIVLRDDLGGWKIDAGRLNGIYDAAVLGVLPRGSDPDKAARSLAFVRVRAARLTESFVVPYDPDHPDAVVPDTSLRRGASCTVIRRTTQDLRLPVALDTGGPGKRPGEPALPTLPEAEAARLRGVLNAVAVAPRSPVVLEAEIDGNEWLIQKPSPRTGLIVLVSPDRSRSISLPDGPDLAARLGRTLAAIAKAQNLVRIAGLWEQEKSVSRGEALDIDVRAVRVDQGRETPLADAGGTLTEVEDGKLVRLSVTNKGSADVDFNFLLVTSEFRVKPLYPADVQDYNRLSDKATPSSVEIRVHAGAAGVDELLVIAVKANPLAMPAQFLFLEQDGIEEQKARDLMAKDRSDRASAGPSLIDLLVAAGFPGSVAGTRGDPNALAPTNCAVKLFRYRIVPAAPAATPH